MEKTKTYFQYSFGSTKKLILNIGIYGTTIVGLIALNVLESEGGPWVIIANVFLVLILAVNALGDYKTYKEYLKREAAKNA